MQAKWAIWAIVVAVSFTAGVVSKDFLDFRSEQRKLTTAAVERTTRLSGELTPVLEKFARAAHGDGIVTDLDRQELRRLLAAALASARVTAQLIPELQSEFETYAAAVAELQQTANQMRGGLNVNRFVSAISGYRTSEDRFNRAAAQAYQGYFQSLARRWSVFGRTGSPGPGAPGRGTPGPGAPGSDSSG